MKYVDKAYITSSYLNLCNSYSKLCGRASLISESGNFFITLICSHQENVLCNKLSVVSPWKLVLWGAVNVSGHTRHKIVYFDNVYHCGKLKNLRFITNDTAISRAFPTMSVIKLFRKCSVYTDVLQKVVKAKKNNMSV